MIRTEQMNTLQKAKRKARTRHHLICRAKKQKTTSKAAAPAPAMAKEILFATNKIGSLQLLV